MKNIIGGLLMTLMISAVFTSCKKDEIDNPLPVEKGTFEVAFTNVFGMTEMPFELNKLFVHPKTGDSLTFTMLRYYVSNIKLVKNDGSIWSEDESYHLVDASDPNSMKIALSGVPVGTYKELQYTMGVDSIRNVSGAQEGALAPSNGMFWSWSTGYIFLKAEGTSPQSANNSFMFHLGGFMNPNNIVTNKTTDFGSATLEIATDKKPSVLLKANPARLWHSASSVSVLSTIHMPGANAVQMATDFYSNIYFDKIQ